MLIDWIIYIICSFQFVNFTFYLSLKTIFRLVWILFLKNCLSLSCLNISEMKLDDFLSLRVFSLLLYEWKEFEKLNPKLAQMTNHLTFLWRCRDLMLVPPGLTIKIPVHFWRAQKVTKRLERELIRDRIHNNHWEKHQLRLEIPSKLTPFLERISMIDDRTRIQQYQDKSYEHEFHMVKACQITKLEKMKTTDMKIQSHYSRVEAIVNISKRQLTAPEKSVLNKGINFATTIKRIPYLDLIAPIEDAALKIPKAKADELRWKVRLEKSKPPKPNILKTERQALKSLQDDNSLIILSADKDNATVVMDRVEYSNKLADLIGNGGYCKVKKEPEPEDGKKLSQILV